MWANDAYNLTISTTALSLQEAIEAVITWWKISWNDFAYMPTGIDILMETNSIRWLDTWETPTSTLWHLADASWIAQVSLRDIDITNLKMIRAWWSDATLSVRIGNPDRY